MIARLLLIFAALAFSSQLTLAQFSQQGPKLVGDDAVGPNTAQGWSVAISADANTAIVGGYGDNGNIGAAWIYTRSGGVWTQQGKKLVGNGAVGKSFQGYSVAVSADGNTAIVGGPDDNPGSSGKSVGAAWVFTRSDGVWSPQGNKLVGIEAVGVAGDGAGQGASVALSGDGNTLIIGGPGDNWGVGAAWVFTRRDGVWIQQGSKLVGTGAIGGGNGYSIAQGHSVALSADGNTAIIGGPGDNSGSPGNSVGAAWIFTRNDGIWTQQGSKLTGNDAVNGPTGAQQGIAVALSADGNTAMVGGYGDNVGTGAAWVFTRSNSIWTQQGSKLIANDAVGAAQQGSSVALSTSGNTALVGGWKDAWAPNVPGTGAVWVYTRTGNTWTQQDSKLVGTGAVNGTLGARLGYSVALSADGTTAIMGGYGDNQSVGAAWVFSSLPIFQVAPSLSVVSAGMTGGPFTPSYFQYQLSASAGSVDFSISGIPTWLNASFMSGTLTSQPLTVTFTLTANAKYLAVGTYTTDITFTNVTNGRGNTSRTATLTVNAPSPSQTTPTATLTVNTQSSSQTMAAAVSTITIGETAITPNNDSGNANLLTAQQASLSQTATIQSMSFYVTAAAGKLRLGIFDATGPGGGPGTIIAETAEITPVIGWNTANVTSQASLPAGTYWLAYLPSSNSLGFRNAQTGSAKYYSLKYGALPTTFSTKPKSGTFHFSFYATLIPSFANTPTVSAVSPNTGPSAGGTSVSITGTAFTGATAVNFGGSAASGVIVNSATSITATAPAHAAGAVNVTVTTPSGTSATSASDTFTYTAAPTVSAVSPNTGPSAGGTSVSITGTAFTGATAVNFGGSAASGVIVNSATSITATAPAHAAGAVNVTVTTPSGTSATSASDTFTYTAASSATPTLIQHVASSANPIGLGISGNNFKIPLPNSVGSGNAIILGMTYPHGSSPTITDNNGNTWPTTAAVSADAGSGGYISSIWVLPNANAGQTAITVSFASTVIPFNYVVSEFSNVATASPINGTHATANGAGPSLTTGSFTPGNNDSNGGNLIWNYYAVSGGANGNPTSWVSGSGFTLLDADIAWTTKQGFPHASQYLVQTTAAAINPSITATADTNDSFNGVAVALKAAAAGTAAPASSIHVNKIIHQTDNLPTATWTVQEPATGNLRVITTTTPGWTSVTDNEGGTWTLVDTEAAQIWYSPNKSANPNLTLSIKTGSGANVNTSIRFYDISGAAASPFDVSAQLDSTDVSGQSTINNAPTITPTTANGLVIAVLQIGNGPGLGLNTGAPTGAIFDLVTYTGEIDFDLMENADGNAHLYNTSIATENWNWLITAISNNSVSATAVAFKSAIAISAPTVSAVSPNTGPSAGGTSVSITGTAFTGATAVNFGGSAASGVIVNSATSITATAPAHAAGAVNVTVTTPSGTSATSASDTFTYTAAPTVSAVSPNTGPSAGGTSVSITGTAFTGATAVNFGGSAASGVIVNSATSITATAPAHAAGAVNVTVTTPSGTSATSASDTFTYTAAPTVSAVSPNTGPSAGGTSVSITGTAFTGATAVNFGGSAASGVIVNSATSITATAPAHAAGAVNVTVTTPSGTSATSASDTFTYTAAPTVSAVSPNTGPSAGGTSVSITGTAFTGATAVNFGGSAASGVIVNSATSITATAPAHAAGAVNVTVTTPSGTSATSASDTFTYTAAPTVSAVSPNTGPSAGGTSVSITGTAFTGATAVNFGGSAASGVIVNSATSITATAPAHAAGAVNVTVTTPSGTSATSASDTFTYTAAPTVSAVSPNTGPSAGGTSVSITGTAFTGATAVNFGGSAASGVIVNSATSITATAPAHAAGAVNVTVTTPSGTSATSASDTFTYTAAPTVSAVSPNTGPSAGGTSVSITGTAFTGATAVNFGGSAASGVIVNSATSITATAPAHAAGAVNVTVTTPSGTSATSASDTFTYTAAPTVSAVSPNTGPSAGGTSVSITGTAFTGATAVNFGGSAASGVIVNSATSITATAPAHAAGAVNVTVTTPSGTSATSASDTFTYTAASSATPTLIQHVSFQSNENFEKGNAFVYNLPNAVLSGNCVIVSLTFAYSASRTVAITDNNGGNTWTQLATVNDTGQGLTSRIYASFNTAAGTSKITVTFDAALEGVQANISEFYNIAISSATDGSHTASSVATSGTITSGSFSTTVNGDLIYQFGANTTFGTQFADHPTNFTPGSGFAPLVMDHNEGTFIQWQAQSSFGATNPGFISTDGGSGTYNSITVALKAATAGTAPSATAIRVVKVYHTNINTYPLTNGSSANFTSQFPTTGNLFVAATPMTELQEKNNSLRDNINGPWTMVTGTNQPQFAYKQNATPGVLTLTINITEQGAGIQQLVFYDVVNADASATPSVVYNSGGIVAAGGTITPAPTITPGTANGLIIANLNEYTGPVSALTSPSGGVLDTGYFTGYTDLDPLDNGNGVAHYYNPNTSAVTFTWTQSPAAAGTGWIAAAMAFKSALP